MRVFISWSGERSRRLAEAFKKWIPAVLQAARPYFTPADIEKGARWAAEIAKELEASKFGLIFLTSDNVEAPWIMFEAGALSKSIDKTRVVPLLFGLEPADIKGPLVQFQAAPFAREQILACVKAINAGIEAPLQSDVLESVFAKWWPDLEKEVGAILAETGPKKSDRKQIRNDRELLEEVLELSRALHQKISTGPAHVSSSAVRDIVTGFSSLVDAVDVDTVSDEVREKMQMMVGPLLYLARRIGGSPGEAISKEMRRVQKVLFERAAPVESGGPDDIPF